MDWKKWFDGAPDKTDPDPMIPDLDRRRQEEDRRQQETPSGQEDPAVGMTGSEPQPETSVTRMPETVPSASESAAEPDLQADLLPQRAPEARKPWNGGTGMSAGWNTREEPEEFYEEEYDGEEEYPEDYRDSDDEHENPVNSENRKDAKREAKKRKAQIRKIVRGFRIRSLGMDFLGLCGLAGCAVSGIFLHRLVPGFLVGTAVTLVVGIGELLSWIGAAGDVKDKRFAGEPQEKYRKSVYGIGVRCCRILGILYAWQLALVYIDLGVGKPFTWMTWAIYGVLFSILISLGFFYLHPLVQGMAHLRGIARLTEEQKAKRKGKRAAVILWRLVGILLIAGVCCGQVYLNQRRWQQYTDGQHYDDVESFRRYLETEVLLDADAARTYLTARPYEEFYDVTDPRGNVIARIQHKNQKVTAIDRVVDETGENVIGFIAYSYEDEEAGRWKKEVMNLFFFAVYPVITLICGILTLQAIRRKKRKAQEQNAGDDDFDDGYDADEYDEEEYEDEEYEGTYAEYDNEEHE